MFDFSPVIDVPRPEIGMREAESQSAIRYIGPERRATSRVPHWLIAAFDEIDYGIVLLGDLGEIVHVNHIAHCELDDTHPLQLLAGRLHARASRDTAPLHEALEAATLRGLRKLLTLGEDAQRVSVSVVPLSRSSSRERGVTTLVMLGKRHVCEVLSVHGFARGYCLTIAETRLLVALCNGMRPTEAAKHFGVAISTVRTQICSIRIKTGAQSLRDLVRQVAVLPPLMGVLRNARDGQLMDA